ncbi:hypothetical protein [Tenacibaculum holothuriorum]|uniref:hypothetical protein n=1 Tax=Tenacibaculum holothuriorum TaxID=1635173 RepID=UPI0011814D76|nr:hypothetical protein [Tenacibaculum holothuriorum]
MSKTKLTILSILLFVFSFLYINNNPAFYTELIPKKIKEVLVKKDFEKNYYFNGSELRILYTRFLYEFEEEDHIFFKGYGLNATQEKLNQKCNEYRVPEGYGTTFNFHNQYNQTMAEIGFFGLLLLLIILFLSFKNAVHKKDKFTITVFIIFASLMITESILNRQRGIYFFSIIFLLLLNTKKPISSTNPND